MNLMIYTPVRLFGEALAAALERAAEIDDVITCEAADRVADTVLETKPDLVLFDVTLERALAEARGVVASGATAPMIALALPERAKEVIACADAGFVAYVPRDASIDDLRGTMRMALRGEVSCHPKVVACLLRELRRRCGIEQGRGGDPLSKREAEVLRLVGRGLSNKEVARDLGLSLSTVKAHMHSILVKRGVRRRGEAIAQLRNEPWLERGA